MKDLTRKDKELWLKDLEYSIKNAKELYEAGFYDMSMLCIQLAVEKALKAAIANFKGQEPPKDHSLARLYFRVKDRVILSEEQVSFLRRLTDEAYATRYMDVSFRNPREMYTKERTKDYMQKAMQIIKQIKSSMGVQKSGDESNNG